jgi:putative flippase GtrA
VSDRSHLFRFALVGVAAFFFDWLCLTLFMALGAGFPLARALSYICSVTSTWWLNRMWTFASTDSALFKQWLKFVSANTLGGSLNYGVSVGLVLLFPRLFLAVPVLALIAGSLCGMVVNFILSKRYVFRS